MHHFIYNGAFIVSANLNQICLKVYMEFQNTRFAPVYIYIK